MSFFFFYFAFIFERVLLGMNSGQQIFFSFNTLKILLFFFFCLQCSSEESDVHVQHLFPPLADSTVFSASLTLSSLTMMSWCDSPYVCYAWLHWTSWICGFISVHGAWKFFGHYFFKYFSLWSFFLHFSSLFRDSSCPYIKPFEVGKSSNIFIPLWGLILMDGNTSLWILTVLTFALHTLFLQSFSLRVLQQGFQQCWKMFSQRDPPPVCCSKESI